MIITRVVGDDINHDLDSGLVECVHHDIKVFECTDLGVDISVVGNIICISGLFTGFESEEVLTTTILESGRVERR